MFKTIKSVKNVIKIKRRKQNTLLQITNFYIKIGEIPQSKKKCSIELRCKRNKQITVSKHHTKVHYINDNKFIK